MAVNVQCGGNVFVALDFLDLLHIDTLHQHNGGTKVPLWHNKDKSDKPLRRNGLNGLSLFFFH